MNYWRREPFDSFINEGRFRVTDSGPLHGPILSFSIRRNDKLEIILETVGDEEAESNAVLQGAGLRRAGTVRINTDCVEIQSMGGNTARLSGVGSRTTTTSSNCETGKRELREEAKLHAVEAVLHSTGKAAYTIDWLENAGSGYYIWPDTVIDKTETVQTRAFGRTTEALTLLDINEEHSSGRRAIHLTVSGVELYLCSAKHKKDDDQIKPGYILYLGTPDNDVRHKIRTVLSFTLGIYLVYLGSATYSSDWKLASFKAISAYSIDKKVFELPTMPPALLGTRAHNELSHGPVSRLVNALYVYYDDLEFGSLSWAYWHAVCAPLHIAAVHFGAAIEALQRRYLAAHSEEFATRIISDKGKWEDFAGNIGKVIETLALSGANKEAMRANIGLLNQVPRRALTDELIKHLDIELGEDEKKAWRRRHDAAHGNDMAPGIEPEIIRDTKLLKVLFHRMLLKIVDGSDHYYDYASLDFPIRNLREPVPPAEDASPVKG